MAANSQSIALPIELDASDSTASGEATLTYQWSLVNRPQNSAAEITNDSASLATLVGDVPGDYQFELIVHDGDQISSPAQVTVTLTNASPIADAGEDQAVSVQDMVTLDGSESLDEDGHQMTYSWTVVSIPEQADVQLSADDSVQPFFIANEPGQYIFSLTVNDGFTTSEIDQVTVIAESSTPLNLLSVDVLQSHVVPGNSINYVIHVSNPGQDDLHDVMLTMELSDGVSFHRTQRAHPDANCGAAVCSSAAGVSWSLESLESGDSHTFDVLADVDGDLEIGTILHTVFSLSSTQLSSPVNLTREIELVANRPLNFALTTSRDAIAPGESFIYAVDVGNADNQPAEDVNWELVLPAGVTVRDFNGDGTADGNVIRWSELSVAQGQSVNRWVEVTVSDDAVEGEILTAVAQLRYDGGQELDRRLSSSVTVSEPLLLDIQYEIASAPVAPGGQIQYLLTVSNLGSVDPLNDVALTLRLPDGVSFHITQRAHPDVACNSATCSFGQEVRFPEVDLAVGESRTFEILADVAADTPLGSLLETPLTVSAPSLGDTVRVGRVVPIAANENVAFAVTPSKDPVAPGESFIYQLDLGNHDDSTLTNSAIQLTVPAGLTVGRVGAGGSAENNVISWSEPSVAPGQSVNRWVEVTVSDDAVEGEILTAVAQLRHDGGQELDRRLSSSVTVSEPLLLDIQYEIASAPVAPGGQIQYLLTVSNLGSVDPLNDVVMTLRLPDGVSFHITQRAHPDVACNSATCSFGQEVRFPEVDLAVGESRTFEILADVAADTPLGSLLETPLTVSAPSLGDTVRVGRVVPIAANENVAFAVTPSKDPVAPGESFIYQLDLGNHDDSTLTNSAIQLTVPAGLTVGRVGAGGSAESNVISWSEPSVAPGQSVNRWVEVTVSDDAVEGEILTAVVQLRHDGGQELDRRLSSSVTVSEPLLLDIQYEIASAPVAPGGQIQYLLTVSNLGSVDPLNDVVMTLRLPDGVSFHITQRAHPDVACNSATCSFGQEVRFPEVDLAVGESRTFEILADVAAGASLGSLLETSLTVTAPSLRDTVRISRTVPVAPTQAVDFSVVATADAVQPGQVFTYQVVVGNSSNAPLPVSSLQLSLPSGVAVAAVGDDGASDGDVVDWGAVDLAVGQVVTRSVEVTVLDDVQVGKTLTAKGQLRHDGGLSLDREVYSVLSVADPLLLSVDYQTIENSVNVGGTISYRITLENTSAVRPLSDITTVLRVPTGVRFHITNQSEPDARCSSATCSSGSEASWSVSSLAAGESATIEVDAVVTDEVSPGQLIQTAVTVTAPTVLDTLRYVRFVEVQAP